MYAHRTIETITDLHIHIELPAEFANCQQAEIIVLPIDPAAARPSQSWQERVLAMAGTLSDDFPDDIDDSDLGQDVPRDSLE